MSDQNSSLTITVLQIDVEIGNPDHNFAVVEEKLNQAVQTADKPDVIVLPEMWNTGYALTEIDRLADREGERTRQLIAPFCAKHQVHVVAGSVANRKDGQVSNTVFVFNRQGEVIAEYDKIHLFRLMEEEKYLRQGEHLGRFELDGIPCAVVICYDIRFPELARTLALDGARLLFVPAQWPNPRKHHWRTLLQARAIENQMAVAACNRVGISGKSSFFGHSMIINPWGEPLVEGGEEEALLTATVSLEEVAKVRSMIPVFEDRRPGLYTSPAR
nr:carbon-nitrogen family hydrolase [Paenibacillus senegalensis]